MQEQIEHFISWAKPSGKESINYPDGLIIIDEGVVEGLPPSIKTDLIKYLRDFLNKEDSGHFL